MIFLFYSFFWSFEACCWWLMREEFIPVLITLQTLFVPRGLWLLGSKWKHHSQVGYHVMDSRWLHGKILLNFVMWLCSALSSEQQGVVFNLLFNPHRRHTVQGSMTSWPTHYRIWGGKKKCFWDLWNNLTLGSTSFFVYCKYEELGMCHNGCPLWGALSHYKIWLAVFFFLHRQRLRSLTGNNTGIFQVLLVGKWAGAGQRMRLYGPCLGQKQSAKVIAQHSPPTPYHTAVLGPLRLSICCLPVSLTVSRLPTVAKEECYHLFRRIQSIILLFSRWKLV